MQSFSWARPVSSENTFAKQFAVGGIAFLTALKAMRIWTPELAWNMPSLSPAKIVEGGSTTIRRVCHGVTQ